MPSKCSDTRVFLRKISCYFIDNLTNKLVFFLDAKFELFSFTLSHCLSNFTYFLLYYLCPDSFIFYVFHEGILFFVTVLIFIYEFHVCCCCIVFSQLNNFYQKHTEERWKWTQFFSRCSECNECVEIDVVSAQRTKASRECNVSTFQQKTEKRIQCVLAVEFPMLLNIMLLINWKFVAAFKQKKKRNLIRRKSWVHLSDEWIWKNRSFRTSFPF